MRRSVEKFALVTLAAGLIFTVVSGDSRFSTRSKPFAYVTEKEVVVIRNGSVITRRDVYYDRRLGTLTSTLDGRYFVLFDGSSDHTQTDPQDRTLVVLDSITGGQRAIPCTKCREIVPIGGARLLLQVEDSHLQAIYRIDVSTADPPSRFALPPGPSIAFLTSAPNAALAVSEDATRMEETYFLVNSSGHIRQIAKMSDWKKESTTAQPFSRTIGVAAASRARNGALQFAVSNGAASKENMCEINGTVTILGDDQPTPVDTDISPVIPSGTTPGSIGGVFAVDIWWSDEGELHAIFGRGTCVMNGVTPVFAEYSEWRLRRMRWERVSTESISFKRQLDRHTTVHASPPGKLKSARELWLTRGRHTRLIAKDYSDISVAPL